jgi:tungstate transport system ATP-binding protein
MFGGLGLLFTLEGMIIAQTLLILPLVWGLSWSAMENVPREVLETHRMLGRKDGVMTHLREARGGVVNASLVGFGRAIAEVGAVMIIGGNIAGKTRVLTTSIVLETSQGDLDSALSLGGILLLIALLASAIALLIEIKKGGKSSPPGAWNRPVFKTGIDIEVDVVDLNWVVDGNQILSDVSLKFKSGECVAVLGASGSGKSSLLRNVAGLEKDGYVSNVDVMMVHQRAVTLYGDVLTNVMHSGVESPEGMWWLKQVGLEDFATRDPTTLSGGERQRLALVRALSSKPEVLLLDEFTANLDGPNVSMLEKLVMDFISNGGAVLLATHNPFQSQRMANRTLILEDGNIVSRDSLQSQALLDGSWLG